MSAAAPLTAPPVPAMRVPGLSFAVAFVALVVGAGVLAGAVPVAFSIATVFLFAGPHNWLEARYVLGRLPARVGKLWPFFLLSAVGMVGLTAGFAALPWLFDVFDTAAGQGAVLATWNTAFVFWVAALTGMRSRTNPRFDGGWVWPVAFLLTAGVWLNPVALNVVMVYLHPLMALLLLDRELGRSRKAWRPAYRVALLAVPLGLALLYGRLHDTPDLPGTDALTAAITNHAGAGYLENVSTHFLVAAHTFLEMVHYGAWVVLIPLVGLRAWPWQLGAIPAARRSPAWGRGVAAFFACGLLVVLTLWACFLLDYPTTRSVYFTVALLHVLAEIPFLLRMV
ncbi:hypothetical protein [Urbifossiella limnaea]|uniref:Uncharacterized protein n=1 Tax=Urbifossiella limnaea TaxID=2528023 RepID=A0A517XZ46_9BACT|nr:hypothetical protein [Urbifossiella limnaea]QDU22782.1 hypothetical protein ETAA1_47700 [Urbifossiella limnaea]